MTIIASVIAMSETNKQSKIAKVFSKTIEEVFDFSDEK
jgi:DNA-binding XRE family transcriptional regulator